MQLAHGEPVGEALGRSAARSRRNAHRPGRSPRADCTRLQPCCRTRCDSTAGKPPNRPDRVHCPHSHPPRECRSSSQEAIRITKMQYRFSCDKAALQGLVLLRPCSWSRAAAVLAVVVFLAAGVLVLIQPASAQVRLSADADGITHDSAILTIQNWPQNQRWWYSSDTGPHHQCKPTTQTTTDASVALTGLSRNTDYVYTAYGHSSCDSSQRLADVSFTTLTTLEVSSITHDSATLTIGDYTAGTSWYYKSNKVDDEPTRYPHSGCTTATSQAVGLESLWKGTGYVYTAYKDPSCSAIYAVADAFDTRNPTLEVSGVTHNAANLSIDDADYLTAWHYKADKGPDVTCRTASGSSAGLTGLSRGSGYVYTAYSDSGCTSGGELDSHGRVHYAGSRGGCRSGL